MPVRTPGQYPIGRAVGVVDSASVDPGAPALGSTFLNDTFTDTNGTNLTSHTGETGATWTQHTSYGTGSWKIQNNRAFSAAATTGGYYASGTPATAEYDVIGTVFVAANTAGEVTGIAGRIDTSANTMYLARYVLSTTKWQLAILSAGSLTVLDTSVNTFSYSVSGQPVVRLALRDAFKGLYVDDVLVASSTDNTITAKGKAGIRWFSNGTIISQGYNLDRIQGINV